MPKDSINYRYEIIDNLGKGAFGKVFKVFDHKDQKHYALKILFNKENLKEQAQVEINLLKYLNKHDPKDKKNVIRMLNSFEF